MFKLFKRTVRTNWFPDQPIIRDRWGDPQNKLSSNPEFAPRGTRQNETVRHMRWSLGLM